MRRLLVVAGLLVAMPAGALLFTVDSTVDAIDTNPGDGTCASASDGCTLRAAIMETNNLPGADQISVPAGTYVLTLPPVGGPDEAEGDLNVYDALTLTGGAAHETRIDAAGNDGVLYIGSGTGLVVVQDLTLEGGARPGLWINSSDDVRVSRTVITGNAAQAPEAGGIVAFASGVTLAHSTVSANMADSPPFPGTAVAGAILAFAGRVEIVNSTISGNGGWCFSEPREGSGGAGAVWAAVGAEVHLAYSTVAGNFCPWESEGGIPGWALLADEFSSISAVGSVISNAPTLNCFGLAEVLVGPNVDSDGTCGGSTFTAVLGPLQDNGGPTPTHALLPGSTALDSVPPADCTYDDDGDPATPDVPLADDQRGARRPQGIGCDIGAFEATACSDGLDNDSDGYTDYPADPGCRNGTSTLERTQCQDGLNNDYAVGIDFDGGASVNGGLPISTADPQCVGKPWRNTEASGAACGLGFEVSLALLPLALARRGRERSRQGQGAGQVIGVVGRHSGKDA